MTTASKATNRANAQPSEADPWVSVPEAAAMLGVARPTVKTLALQGKLRTQVVGGLIFVHIESLEALIAERIAERNAESKRR